MSVYREPVDRIGLAWQISDVGQPPTDPDREARIRAVVELLRRADEDGVPREQAGLTAAQAAEWEQYRQDLRRPPVRIPAGFAEAVDTLTALGLLAPAHDESSADPVYLVHRWTASSLAGQTRPDDLVEAHRRAATYWQWRVAGWPQDRVQDVAELVEARHHLHTAGDLDSALSVTDEVCDQLHTWGAWDWEQRLYLEAVGWLDPDSRAAARGQHQLGIIAQGRGDYEQAEEHYRRSLAIKERLGDQARLAASHHQLGMLAQARGEYGPAEEHYRRALAILERLGDQARRALSLGQLGALYTTQRRPAEAVPYTLAALAFFVQAGAAEAATSVHWLGVQRRALGDAGFTEILQQHLDADSVGTVVSLTMPEAGEQTAGP